LKGDVNFLTRLNFYVQAIKVKPGTYPGLISQVIKYEISLLCFLGKQFVSHNTHDFDAPDVVTLS